MIVLQDLLMILPIFRYTVGNNVGWIVGKIKYEYARINVPIVKANVHIPGINKSPS